MAARSNWVKNHSATSPRHASGDVRMLHLNGVDPSRSRWSVVEVRLAPGRGHPAVRHRRTHEWVYVAQGRLAAAVGRRRLALRRGATLYLPPGVWHAFRNPGRRLARVLTIFDPPLDWKAPDAQVRGTPSRNGKHGSSR